MSGSRPDLPCKEQPCSEPRHVLKSGKARSRCRKHHIEHIGGLPGMAKRMRDYRAAHIDENREYHRAYRGYPFTEQQYREQLAKQDGVCAICGRPPKKQRLGVDHNHRTGEIRGLLCTTCNRMLGWYETYAEQSASYIENPPARTTSQ